MKRKQKVSHKWFWVGFLAILLGAPNATIIKYTSADIDTYVFNCLRFALPTIICLPYIYKTRKQLNRKSLGYAALVGLFLSIAVITFVPALKMAPASYVSILTLISPIIFVMYSIKLTSDKIDSRAIVGITMAALGAFVIVFLPVALAQGGKFEFYPESTILMLINALTYPLAVIYSRKSNEAGLNLISVMGISSIIIVAVNAVIVLGSLSWQPEEVTGRALIGIVYSGIIVALIARALAVASYEHVGAAVISSLTYLETMIAIAIPMFFLGEKLSIGMVAGGALILTGVYLAEHHKSKHSSHFHLHRHH